MKELSVYKRRKQPRQTPDQMDPEAASKRRRTGKSVAYSSIEASDVKQNAATSKKRRVVKQNNAAPPKHQRVVKQRRVVMSDRVEKQRLCTLKTRMSPSSATKVIERLTDEQKKAVSEIGFGSLLSLKITRLPLQMAYWVVDNVEVSSCSLKLPTGVKIPINEEDVHHTLGLPMGEETIVWNEGTSDDSFREFLTEWKARYGVVHGKGQVLMRDIVKRLMETEESDDWFKRDFVIMCVSLLLRGISNVNASQWILRSLRDTKNICNLNW